MIQRCSTGASEKVQILKDYLQIPKMRINYFNFWAFQTAWTNFDHFFGQRMNTIGLLNALHSYQLLLTAIAASVMGDGNTELIKTISLSYDTIKLKVDKVTRQAGEDNRFSSPALYLQCVFQINQQQVAITDIYCELKDQTNELKDFILQHTPAGGWVWNTKIKEAAYSAETLNYLTIADRIAKEVYLCASGDNYRPGYYSEIIVEEKHISLKQINRHNSRSVNHKDDYHLRDLEFLIPLQPAPEKPSFQDEQIGEMRIHFSDHSSKNNKACGNRISEKIREEKLKFNNR